MAATTTYALIHSPLNDRQAAYEDLARLFTHLIPLSLKITQVGLDYLSISSSNVQIENPWTVQTTATGVNAVDSTTVNVASTTGFIDVGGEFNLLGRWVSYTGKTSTSFTGCNSHEATVGGEAVGGVAPQTVLPFAVALDAAVIQVDDTTGYPEGGSMQIQADTNEWYEITYTGITPTSFTGCGAHPAFSGAENVHGERPLHIEQAAHLGLTANPGDVVVVS